MECSICHGEIDKLYHPETGEMYWDQGHNAQPINDGRCCTECNNEKVLARRIKDVYQRNWEKHYLH